jgi:hypothetical protein
MNNQIENLWTPTLAYGVRPKLSLFLKMTAKLFVLMHYHWQQHDLKKGELKFLLLLEISFIIKVRAKDAKTILLTDDYDAKWQITVGDGLSQMRMRQCNDTINVTSVNF